MSQAHDILGLYLHLANASEKRNQPLARAKFMVLSANCAHLMGLEIVADYCRHLILKHNPGHLLKRYQTFAEGYEFEELQSLIRHLQKTYPQEKSEHMLASMGIEQANERATYADDLEYAAALLEIDVDTLKNFQPEVPEPPEEITESPRLGDFAALEDSFEMPKGNFIDDLRYAGPEGELSGELSSEISSEFSDEGSITSVANPPKSSVSELPQTEIWTEKQSPEVLRESPEATISSEMYQGDPDSEIKSIKIEFNPLNALEPEAETEPGQTALTFIVVVAATFAASMASLYLLNS